MLDASALRSPDDRRSQQLVLQMVQASARQIEDAWFMRQHARHLVLRLGRQRDFLEVACDGLVALDATGRIVAASPRLRSEGGAAAEPLVGQHFEQVFDARLDAVAAAASQSATLALALRRRPADPPRFALARAPRVEHRAPRKSARTPAIPSRLAALAALAGQDPHMAQNVERALRVLDKGLDVLLLGESGTGKELFARAMHEASARAGAAFVALNCAAIPESLLESELFGYLPGAWTGGASKGRQGLVEAAHRGTLFLDEIGDMPLALQAKLLRVLSESQVLPLGAREPRTVDIRVVSASHRPLAELVQSGQFRQDLLYRLNAAELQLPPLRQRRDLGGMMDRMLADLGSQYSLGEAARAMLLAHPWPGNLRELNNVLRYAVALCGDGPQAGAEAWECVIEPVHLPDSLQAVDVLDAGPSVLQMGSAAALDEAGGAGGRFQPGGAVELEQLLAQCHGNVSEVARQLGVSRSTVHRRIQRLQLGVRCARWSKRPS